MDEEYNPFQSPAAPPPTPSYAVPGSLYHTGSVVPFATGHVRAVFTMTLLVTVIIADLLGCWSCVGQNAFLDSIMRGARPGRAAADANDRLVTGIAIGDGIANLAAAIAFLMWVHRTYRNLPALGAPRLESTPGWAVGWYFVPFANFVKPCQTMSETWRYSDPAQYGKLRTKTSALVGIWWAAFIITHIVDRISAVNAAGINVQPTLQSLKDITNFCIAAYVIELVAAAIAIMLVYSVDKNQQAKHDLLVTESQTAPAAGAAYP